MQQTVKIGFGFAAVALLTLILHTAACKSDPLYTIPTPDPVDTTGTGGGNSGALPCNPDSVYFSQQILPILTSNCAMPGCHDAVSKEEGIILDSYTNTLNTGKIKISNPADSKIYKVLIDTDVKDRMPPAPRQALTADQSALVLKWIQQGAKNLTCDSGCDTTNVTFSASVMPLISLKCKGCHGGSLPQGGVSLSNYAEVKVRVADGSLIGAVTRQPGFTAMPYPAGSARLPDCDIRKIQIWIDGGALNN